MKPIVITMKALLGASFVWMVLMFFRMIDTSIIELSSITTLLTTLRNVFLVGIFYIFNYLFFGFSFISSFPFSFVPGFNSTYGVNFGGYSFSNIIFEGWFPRVKLSSRAIELLGNTLNPDTKYTIPEYMAYIKPELQALGQSAYLIMFQVLVILLILYGIMTVLETNPRHSIRAILFLNLMIILPLILFGVENLIQVFKADFNLGQYIGIFDVNTSTGNVLPYPIHPDIVFMPIPEKFGQFLISPIFQIAISSFIFLEFTFQLNYVYQVTSPSEQRAERLYEQIQTLKRASQEAVVHLEQIETGQPSEFIEQELDEEGNIVEKTKVESVRKFLSKTATGFSFIREMIERRKLEEKTKKAIEALQDTRRLSNYLNRLFEQDPEAEHSLTAKNSAPRAGRLIRSTVIDMVYRIAGITCLVFIISLTPWIIEHIFRAPDSIVNSVEMFTPEVMLTIFIPLILLFPFISIIIRITKAQQLRKKLMEEEEKNIPTDTSKFVAA